MKCETSLTSQNLAVCLIKMYVDTNDHKEFSVHDW